MTASARGNRLPMFIAVLLFGLALMVVIASWLGGGACRPRRLKMRADGRRRSRLGREASASRLPKMSA